MPYKNSPKKNKRTHSRLKKKQDSDEDFEDVGNNESAEDYSIE